MWKWLTDKDWKTWVGHAVQGVLLVLVYAWLKPEPIPAGILAVAFVFGHREFSDAMKAKKEGRARGRKVVDGFLDFVAPVAAAIATAMVLR